MQYITSEELTQAKQLMKEGKLEHAFQLINKFGKKKALSPADQISYYILKSSLATYFFREKKMLKYAEKAYHESQNLGVSLQLLDVYIQMANALMWQYKLEEPFEFIVKAEDLLKLLTEESSTDLLEREASISYIKGWLYYDKGEKDKGLENAQRGLELCQELDLKVDIGISLWQIGWMHFKSDNDLAINFVDQCIDYCEKINYKLVHQKCHMLKGMIYSFKGELDLALECFEQSKMLFEELPEKFKDDYGAYGVLHLMGMVYLEKDELDKAKDYFERALVIKEEVGAYYSKVMTIDELISLALDKNDLKSAEKYLEDIKRISERENNKMLNLIYRGNKARLLKKSSLISDQAKAEEILKEALEDKVADNEAKIRTLLDLIDLLLIKLRKTDDIKLLDEILLYITQIHNIANSQNSYSCLAETFLLRAKMELLTLNLRESERFLHKAQDLAEKYTLNQLLRRILVEQDEFLNQESKWEALRNSKATIAELINLAHVDEQLTRMLRKRFLIKKSA